MHPLSCPSSEVLFEHVTIAHEISWARKVLHGAHLRICLACRKRSEQLKQTWASYFQPEPDITSSLMKIYSRLQKDETLILKGWKLDGAREAAARKNWISTGWVFRGAIALSLIVLSLFLVKQPESPRVANLPRLLDTPTAQIRFEDANRVRVRYVQPELIHSIQFETTRFK